ncbi:histidine kinase [Robertmurraya siralis]|uniref:Histidine kinase n=1 Tax=Robertmurraya siralis TaxID=77777 RepID=A0A920BSS1_9BACI|nr:GAF domain-containing protein [Robertmurraya siralis]PAE22541.1 GAF domain-containing protein [Bacillus sp. 7504-2]GIN61054.1 histidine kinase [Robertmurraya siralis]
MFNKSKNYEPILQECKQLKKEINCDFVGFAFQNTIGPDIKWHIAAGNHNEKYKLISVRYGKGIAGRVISTGRAMTIEDFPHHIIGKVLEYPIMLAEKLVYSHAVPVYYKEAAKGVLLVGNRSNKQLSREDVLIVQAASNKIEKIISC